MVSFAALSAVALMIASGAVAAPWHSHARHSTHHPRGLAPTGAKLTSYHPPSVFETYGVAGVDQPLTKRATPEEIAKGFLQNKLGLTSDELKRHAGHTSDGVSYEYFTQTIDGIPVANAVANVALKDGKVMSYGASFVKPKNVASTEPKLPLIRGIALAEDMLDGKFNEWPAKLEYVAKDNGDVALAHVVQIQNAETSMWKQAYVDADTGEMVNVVDFVADSSYHAVPLNQQDPTKEYRVVKDPQDMTASPKGWHSTPKHSMYGKEKSETAGNNVVVYKGVDANPVGLSTGAEIVDKLLGAGVAQTSSESSTGENFDYPYDPTKEPIVTPNVDAARTNAFYVVNRMHDLTYKYGFTEQAFNFQDDNCGKGGEGKDRVQVSVQDSSGVNNANFATPPDGQHGQMRMFLWTGTTPMRDGALENDIIVHEYTHGISNRMTGGGTGKCLQTTEAGGMGEGWSDAMADITEAKTNPISDFTLGSYVTNNSAGIRSHPYSTNKNTNPLTYGSLAGREEVHDIGEVWALMLHEVMAALVEKCGIGELGAKEEHGNNVMLHLMMDGFMIQPCNPTFIDARDAILQADACRYNGKYQCVIWKAFAKRGLGEGASKDNRTDNMDIPSECKAYN